MFQVLLTNKKLYLEFELRCRILNFGASLSEVKIGGISDSDTTGNLAITITFNDKADKAAVNAITNAVTYAGSAQTVSLSVTNGRGLSNTADTNITTITPPDASIPVATLETATALATALISVQSSEVGTAYFPTSALFFQNPTTKGSIKK